MANPHAFELRGFRDMRLNGVYVLQDAPEYECRSGLNSYPTYWNEDSTYERPYFMYWQEAKGRHAITPRYDRFRTELPNCDLFCAVSTGSEEPGVAFFRPQQNQWIEYDFRSCRWRAHPADSNITYVQLSRQAHQAMRRSVSAGYGVVLPGLATHTPPSPCGVPAAMTPCLSGRAPVTPQATFGRAPLTPQATFSSAGTRAATAVPGTPPTSLHMPSDDGWGAPAPRVPPDDGWGAPAPRARRRSVESEIASPTEPREAKRSRLEREKRRAIEDEDFDLAKLLKAELVALSAQAAEANDDRPDCAVCFEKTETMYLCIPCGHICMCRNCSQRLEAARQPCPICREPVQRMQVAHFACERRGKQLRRM